MKKIICYNIPSLNDKVSNKLFKTKDLAKTFILEHCDPKFYLCQENLHVRSISQQVPLPGGGTRRTVTDLSQYIKKDRFGKGNTKSTKGYYELELGEVYIEQDDDWVYFKADVYARFTDAKFIYQPEVKEKSKTYLPEVSRIEVGEPRGIFKVYKVGDHFSIDPLYENYSKAYKWTICEPYWVQEIVFDLLESMEEAEDETQT